MIEVEPAIVTDFPSGLRVKKPQDEQTTSDASSTKPKSFRPILFFLRVSAVTYDLPFDKEYHELSYVHCMVCESLKVFCDE